MFYRNPLAISPLLRAKKYSSDLLGVSGKWIDFTFSPVTISY
ncbi:hypothetical protein LEP1GSC202_0891 [Leptospira yanagawae serovar Saopaulo str. Sao Paulo = ATCC 700523]|uniref:Uncharacterized protein n=1 Tax=Leptospira yanagawae serovar Saopaulo str. Sao Paulo = ATCC 700523 TaxID=1249483 RepID=A0A5E8HGL2_9LEPT|nr:hypothetical protein LEP1GSC202_0891 [Leptospira yanagawae serovar Saopaulo str. Sao Paulo = ATCC 700523]